MFQVRPIASPWFALTLLLALGPALAGCGDDNDPATLPEVVSLGDLTLSLEVDRTAVRLDEFVTVRVVAEEDIPDSLLARFACSWGWESRYTYVDETPGLTQATFQFREPGTGELRVRVRDGADEVALAQTFDVSLPATTDGSLEMLAIPEGTFIRGETFGETTFFQSHTPKRSIFLSAYSLARTEMTNAAAASILNWAAERGRLVLTPNERFVSWTPDAEYGQSVLILDLDTTRLTWSDGRLVVPAGEDLYPVAGVRWVGAAAICNWLSEREGIPPAYTFTPGNVLHVYDVSCDFASHGYRLPTEAEWEKAGRGGAVLAGGENPLPERAFPWGNEPVREALVFGVRGSTRANTAERLYGPPLFQTTLFGGPLPVGAFPAGRGPYGHHDLIGNLAEWCYDWFGYNYYPEAPDTDPHGTDTVFPGVEDEKVMRGDSWFGAVMPKLGAFSAEEGCAKRRAAAYHAAANYLGFRVARTAD